MFEKWRVHDTSSAEKLQAEYEKDKQVQSPAEFAKKWEQYGGYDTDDLHGEYERDMARFRDFIVPGPEKEPPAPKQPPPKTS